MVSRPLLLDLFCGAGGAAMGYHRAGFDVVGVDRDPQPDYPFEFVQDDALEFLRFHLDVAGMPTVPTFIHASPPCQASCNLTKGTNAGREYPQLIPQTRELLARTGLPTIIENVQGAAIRRDLTLCGEMFGLDVIRHRYFECSFPVAQPDHVKHRGRVRGWRHGEYFDGPYVAVYGDGGGKGSVTEWQRAMGIDWTDDRKSIAEAIPPAYTEHIGAQLIQAIEVAA
jgi:DNA (cytosine-5)-methyltransferase 1